MRYISDDGATAGEITIDVAPDGFITSMHTSGIDPETYDAQQYRAEIHSVSELTTAGD
jgi:hypothetical protein